MKKKLLMITGIVTAMMAALVVVTVSTGDAYAAKCGDTDTILISCDENSDGREQVCHVMNLIVEIMSIGIGILAVIGIIITGIQYLTAGGNEEKARKSKRRMYELVIGLVLYAALATVIVWLNPGGLFCSGGDGTGGNLGKATCFDDVYENSKYQEAICWAKGNNIAMGNGEGSFKPSEGLKRAEGITLLWRAKGEPASSGNNTCGLDNSLSGTYYYSAALWGCNNGVLLGTNNGLEMDAELTVKQFVTMLYRIANNSTEGWNNDVAKNWGLGKGDDEADQIINRIVESGQGGVITRGEAVHLIKQLL